MVLFGFRILAHQSKSDAPMVRFEMLKGVIARKVLLGDATGLSNAVTSASALLEEDVSEAGFFALVKADVEAVNAFYQREEQRIREMDDNRDQRMRALKRYAAINYVGARKIAKKFDKNAAALGEVSSCRRAMEALLAEQHFVKALRGDKELFTELEASNYVPSFEASPLTQLVRQALHLSAIDEEKTVEDDPVATAPSSSSSESFAVDFCCTYVAYGFVYSCRRALAVAKEPLATASVVSPGMLSSLDSVLLASYVTMQLVVARYGDVLKRHVKPQTLVALAVLAAAFTTYATGAAAHNLPIMVFCWASNGVAQALVYPYVCVLLAAQVAASKRGRIMGAWNTCSATGGVVSAALSAAALKRRGFRGAFEAPAAATAACGIVCLLVLNRRREQPEASRHSTRQGEPNGAPNHQNHKVVPVWKMARVPAVCAAYSLIKPIRYLFLFWHNYYLTAELKFTVEQAAGVEAVETLAALCGGLAFGAAADRFSPFVLFALCLVLLALALLAFRPVSTIGLGPNVAVVFAVSLLIGAVDNLASGLTAATLVELNERTRGSSASIASVVSFLSAAGTLGTLLHGRVLHTLVPTGNWTAVFSLVAVQAAAAAALVAPMALGDARTRRHSTERPKVD